MLQVFHLDVVKVDWNVAHVAVAIHDVSSVYSKCFISFSRRMFARVSSGCRICFPTYEVFLGVFCKCTHVYVANVSSECFKSRSGVATSVFVCMFHMFHMPSDVCCKFCIQMFQK
jgi:hypothetical protein